MNRDIRFRAWIVDNDDGHGDMFRWCDEFFGAMSPVTAYSSDFPTADDESVILMQYTGLKDRNGMEICEGDICEMNVFGGNVPKHANVAGRVVIEYNDSAAAYGFRHIFPNLVSEDDRHWRAFWDSEDRETWSSKYFRIIGNLYENPELLKRV